MAAGSGVGSADTAMRQAYGYGDLLGTADLQAFHVVSMSTHLLDEVRRGR